MERRIAGMNTVFNVLHVVAAVFFVGPMAMLPMAALRSLRAGNAAQVATLATSTSLLSWLSLAVALLGFGALGMARPSGHYSFGSFWIVSSIIAYVVALLLSVFVVVPNLQKASAALAAASSLDAPTATAAKPTGYSLIAGSSGVVAVLLVIVVILMVWKP